MLEIEHVNGALRNCRHLQLALDRGAALPRQKVDSSKHSTNAVKDKTWKPQVAHPYIKGYVEELYCVF